MYLNSSIVGPQHIYSSWGWKLAEKQSDIILSDDSEEEQCYKQCYKQTCPETEWSRLNPKNPCVLLTRSHYFIFYNMTSGPALSSDWSVEIRPRVVKEKFFLLFF